MFRLIMVVIMDIDDKMLFIERIRIYVKVVDWYDFVLRIWKYNMLFVIIFKIKGSKERM